MKSLLKPISWVIMASVAFLGIPVASAGHTTNDYVIKLKEGSTESSFGNEGIILKRVFDENDAQLSGIYYFQSEKSISTLQEELAGQFEYLQLDGDLQIAGVEVKILPNDPGFSSDPKNIDRQWGLYSSGFVDAWQKAAGSKNVTIAVIDTGIDMAHKDFSRSNFVPGYNVIDNTPIRPGVDSDDHGHGTLVTGVIGAVSNNGKGIAGAVGNVRIMPVKAMNASGRGKSSRVAKAIIWAVDHGANVVNLSLGGASFVQDKALADAISYAFKNDVVVIAAAGNDSGTEGKNLDEEPVFPVCQDNGKNMVIGVSAIDVSNRKPLFANYGKSCIDVVAPGKRILSTTNYDPATGAKIPDAFAYVSGTSMAVPFVSAQAALLKSRFPDASSRQIRDRIIATARNVDAENLTQCGGASCAGYLGSGKINVAKSLDEVILPIADKDLVKVKGTDQVYLINGLKRQLISEFVRQQRFPNKNIKDTDIEDLAQYSEGSYATPQDGTLVKTPDAPMVYYISQGMKLPVMEGIFKAYKFEFRDVVTLTSAEINSWATGKLLAPPNTFVMKAKSDPTIYWPVAGVVRPVSLHAYQNMGLSVFPAILIPENLIESFTIGDPLL